MKDKIGNIKNEAMIEYYAPRYGFNVEDIDVKIIGKRIGEKLRESSRFSKELEIIMNKTIKT